MTTASPRTIEILRDLVAFDTTSQASNLELIEYAEDHLHRLGFATDRVPSLDGTKANLVGGAGPASDDGLILSAHTDCVPVEGQQWTTDPFELTDGGDGRWYGRGTADMKGFIASMLARIERIDPDQLTRPLHIALSHDEETGGDGAKNLVAAMASAGIRARHCVVGEPTSMRVVTEHKGIFVFEIDIQGTPAHSSLAPRAVNAIEYGARMVEFLRGVAADRAANGPHVEGYDITHTTVHVGRIAGGTAINIVPKRCVIDFEFRHLPTDDPDAITAAISDEVSRLQTEMKAISPEADIALREVAGMPHLATDEQDGIVGWLRTHTGTELGRVAYGTEAGLFTRYLGVPTVVCGPGSIDQAHARDEYIEDAQLAACDALVDRLLSELAS